MTKIKTPEEQKQELIKNVKVAIMIHSPYSLFESDLNALLEAYHSQFEGDMFLNMQYYMEFCEREGYVTPQDWIDQVIEILKAQKTISCKALRKRGTDDIWVYNPGDIKSFKDMEQIDITIIVEE
jgi:hypothetical protein